MNPFDSSISHQYGLIQQEGLGLSPEWIKAGSGLFNSIIGGSQQRKQDQRQLEMLRLQQQIEQDRSNAALEAEKLRFQALQLQSQNNFNRPIMDNHSYTGDNQNSNTNKILIGLGVATAIGLGLALFSSGNKSEETEEPKALNGLVDTLE